MQSSMQNKIDFNKQSWFYDVNKLSIKDKISILNDAFKIKESWWVDIKKYDSWRREVIKMSFDTIMEKLNNKCHFVIINRYDHIKDSRFGEIGFSTMRERDDYFLWIYLSVLDLKKIAQKYNIKLSKIYENKI